MFHLNVYAQVVKPFSRKLHDVYDSAAREAVIRYMESLGWQVRDNPDIYGIDLLAEAGDRSIGVEVECKRGWTDRFYFKSLHIPKRKAKFLKDDNLFFVLNYDMTQAAVVAGWALALCGFIEKQTSETSGVDVFFEVPLNFVEFLVIEEPSGRKGNPEGEATT